MTDEKIDKNASPQLEQSDATPPNAPAQHEAEPGVFQYDSGPGFDVGRLEGEAPTTDEVVVTAPALGRWGVGAWSGNAFGGVPDPSGAIATGRT
jgi:hypothetical protein